MDDLRDQVELLESSANLSASINDVQKTIDLLTAARAKIAAGEWLPVTLRLKLANRHTTRSENCTFDSCKAPGPVQEELGCCTERLETHICWP